MLAVLTGQSYFKSGAPSSLTDAPLSNVVDQKCGQTRLDREQV